MGPVNYVIDDTRRRLRMERLLRDVAYDGTINSDTRDDAKQLLTELEHAEVRRDGTATESMPRDSQPEGRPMMEQQPSVGRVVHYVAYGTPGGEFPAGVCRAAFVTEVTVACAPRAERLADLEMQVKAEMASGAPRLNLCVINPTGLFFNLDVRFDADKKPGSWHWPERV